MRRTSGFCRRAAVAAFLGVAAVVSAQDVGDLGTSFRPPPGALIAPGRAPDLFLLNTGDVVGFVDPCG
jgi:hypothetical protein